MTSIDNKYYLQALDNFDFSIEETIESLNYALSYNENHSGTHCLLGRVYMEHLHEYEAARRHFKTSLRNDVSNVSVYKWYSLLLIRLGEYTSAQKLIRHAYTVKGINRSIIMQREALLAESAQDYKKAKSLLKESIAICLFSDEIEFLRDELRRVKRKLGKPKKKSKSRAKRKVASDKEESTTE